MRIRSMVLFVLGIALIGTLFVAQSPAQNFNRKTVITFSQPVTLPGKLVLAAGTYTFTILDNFGSRNIVQIWNEDGTKLITTILAINNYRLEATGDTVIQFKERPANTPQAVKAWFYPGFNYGVEFVYPRQEAIEIAQASNEVVPAEAAQPTPETLKTVPLIAVTPESKELPLAKAFPPKSEPVTVAQELPKTASSLPLIVLFGVFCVGIAFGLKRLAVYMS